MCTNFDFLRFKKEFSAFAESSIEAEKSLAISPANCAILSRRATELAVKWLYSFDEDLHIPYRDNLTALVDDCSFKKVIDAKLYPMLKYIIKLGNVAVHSNKLISRDDAILSLRNLYEFIRWIDYCYSSGEPCGTFDESLLVKSHEKRPKPQELEELYQKLSSKNQRIEEIRKENEALRKTIAVQKAANIQQYDFEVDKISESETRKRYVDVELKLAGWQMGKDCLTEVKVEGMPNATGIGYVDYVLYGENSKPLAVVEAKKTSVDTRKGSYQAKLYADCLHNQYGQRPLIFTTNGFEINYTNDAEDFPERQVAGFFSKEEMQLIVDRRTSKKSLASIEINDAISNRYYQKEAITAVCESIMSRRRKMLLVMATGSGKTRTAISIVDVLTRHNYVKNILFLADRTALVDQAKKNFNKLLPNLTLCNLLDKTDNPEQSRMIFSTYPTMMNAIDEAKRKDGKKLFTPGHFDLIIIDESHRSIYKKYQDIFTYFDAMLIGLTATPKDGIDKNTYDIFELENHVPTCAYEYEKAVEDGYLVDYTTREIKSKIMEDGIHYDELSEEEKDTYDETFEADENIEDTISSEAINTWLFNKDTIDMVLNELMEHGIKVEGGDKLGKTIIFAKNSRHAEVIVQRFNTLYPEYGSHFIKQIDYSINHANKLIEKFGEKQSMPQIAVSVDMLDTGIDIPELLNLVFFKKVRSHAKFWQMIGRGTRLCENLFGEGLNKEKFLIFDFCNNFEFFRANPKGKESGKQESLTEKVFNTRVEIVRALQDIKYQEEDYIAYRNATVEDLFKSIQALNPESFRVKLHQKYVDTYQQEQSWQCLESLQVSELKRDIAPLITCLGEDELAKRFDYLIYTVDLAYLLGMDARKPIKRIVKTAEELSKLGSVPQVRKQKELIEKVKGDTFWETANPLELEKVREAFRDLIKLIEKKKQSIYYTNFRDEIIEIKENKAMFDASELKDYRQKVESYLKGHEDDLAIYKLRHNKPLTKDDLKTLEYILWDKLGSKAEYEKEYGEMPVGKLVRKIVGLDRKAANEVFSEFLSEERLNTHQIHFVKLIVDYIVTNGMIEDNRVLMEEPFKSLGSISTLFDDKMQEVKHIMERIAEVRNNCEKII